jgi:hypothetical protein
MFITQNCRTHTRLFVSNVTKPVLWIHSVTLCAASALSLYYVMTFFVVFCCDALFSVQLFVYNISMYFTTHAGNPLLELRLGGCALPVLR